MLPFPLGKHLEAESLHHMEHIVLILLKSASVFQSGFSILHFHQQ